MLPSSGHEENSIHDLQTDFCLGGSRGLHQVCWSRRLRITFFSHGQERCPVATETQRVHASVQDKSPVGAASGFVSQSDTCLALSHVVADVDHLHHQQV